MRDFGPKGLPRLTLSTAPVGRDLRFPARKIVSITSCPHLGQMAGEHAGKKADPGPGHVRGHWSWQP